MPYTRVAVFMDFQNIYHTARDCFASPGDPPEIGQIDPMTLARHLTTDRPDRGRLVAVEVFRGRPDPSHHPAAAAAYTRQMRAWSRYWPLMSVYSLPIRYRPTRLGSDGRPCAWDDGHEKGVDTSMAIRVALGAERRSFDVAILVTGDGDLRPAVDAVFAGGLVAETATWDGVDTPPIRSTRWPTVVHRLGRDVFEAVSDRCVFTDRGLQKAG